MLRKRKWRRRNTDRAVVSFCPSLVSSYKVIFVPIAVNGNSFWRKKLEPEQARLMNQQVTQPQVCVALYTPTHITFQTRTAADPVGQAGTAVVSETVATGTGGRGIAEIVIETGTDTTGIAALPTTELSYLHRRNKNFVKEGIIF